MKRDRVQRHLVRTSVAVTISAAIAGCGGSNGDKSETAEALSSRILASTTQVVPGQTKSLFSLKLLSSKPDYVSAGNALLELTLPDSPGKQTLSVTLNGNDITDVFEADPANHGRRVGQVGGMPVGANSIVARYGNESVTIAMTNYPATGPIISGPHISPYICQTQDFTLPDGSKLGPATDPQCSAPTRVSYMYRSTAGGALKPMPSTTSLPSDVAVTTSLEGVTVPFVVRIETGTLNRGIYQNAILHDPTTEPAPRPLAPPKGWNKRLIANHGTGCAGGWYIQGSAMGVNPYTGDNLKRLGEGYAVFNNTLNHPTNSCNAILAGESALMGKEHFIETFGVPKYTVSVGTSGGSYTSLQLADAFPGLFDGVFINATFPDALSIALSSLDAKLLNRYLRVNNLSLMTETQMNEVSGYKAPIAWYDAALQSGRTDPVPNRIDPIPPTPLGMNYKSAVWNSAVPIGLRYDPINNPTGARPTVFDVARNVYGIDLATGFAQRPFDNVGVQYGFEALNAGRISTTQFLDMNERIGGYDHDGNYTSSRTTGDAGAIRRAYQGNLNLTAKGGLGSIPVFDTSGIYDEDSFYHYQWTHFAVRERLAQAHGDAQNHVMWRGGTPIAEFIAGAVESSTPAITPEQSAAQAAAVQGWATFVKWMDAYKGDVTASTQRDKVIRNKPVNAVDGCFSRSSPSQFVAEPQTFSSDANSFCNQQWPSYSFPRKQAGGTLAADKLKCQLKPLAATDYTVSFNTPELARLNAIFPAGVCDWSKPGVHETGVTPYPSFGPSLVNLIFDIRKH